MGVIQIEITNACDHVCSNCSRLCGHHRKPFMMDFDMFKRAVTSLRGFGRCVGVMGGEPTLHPHFAEFCDFFRDNREQEPSPFFTGPSDDLIKDTRDIYLQYHARAASRGLWSSLGAGYFRHFEKIQDTFGIQALNDHLSPNSYHAGLLITRRELGIPDDEWTRLRDNCAIQNKWSASITPKGAFFCEIAAALDTLLDGPGGWRVEDGWWEREPSEFGDQIHWCELCSAALPVPRRSAEEGRDDISPEWRHRLELVGSPKLRRGDVAVLDVAAYRAEDYAYGSEPIVFMPDYHDRVSRENRHIHPRDIAVINIESPDADAVFRGLSETPGGGRWVLAMPGGVVPDATVRRIEDLVFNPGCLFIDPTAGWRFINTGAAALAAGGELGNIEALYPPEKTIRTALAATTAGKAV
jgi:hypothetical protein